MRTRRRRGSPPRRRRPCPLVCGALWLLPEGVLWASLQARPQRRLMRAPVPSGQGVEASGTPRPKPVCGLRCMQFRVLSPRWRPAPAPAAGARARGSCGSASSVRGTRGLATPHPCHLPPGLRTCLQVSSLCTPSPLTAGFPDLPFLAMPTSPHGIHAPGCLTLTRPPALLSHRPTSGGGRW